MNKKILICIFLLAILCFNTAYAGQLTDNATDSHSQDAIEKIIQDAEKGDAEAQLNLGIMYYIGNSVPQNYQKAAEWYTKAAEKGNAQAQWLLGSSYRSGIGVPQDYQKSLEWYAKAAEKGNARAQFELSIMYSSSDIAAHNYKKALIHCILAKTLGLANVDGLIETCKEHLTPTQIQDSQRESAAIFKKLPKSNKQFF